MIEFFKYCTSGFWIFISCLTILITFIVMLKIIINSINIVRISKENNNKLQEYSKLILQKNKEYEELKRHTFYLTSKSNNSLKLMHEMYDNYELLLHKAFNEYSQISNIPIDSKLLNFVLKKYEENINEDYQSLMKRD